MRVCLYKNFAGSVRADEGAERVFKTVLPQTVGLTGRARASRPPKRAEDPKPTNWYPKTDDAASLERPKR